MKQPFMQRVGSVLEGKGFYIVLFLCVTAIGISGYFLFSGLFAGPEPSLDQPLTSQVVGQDHQVKLPQEPAKLPDTTPPATTSQSSDPAAKSEPEHEVPAKATSYSWPVRGTLSRDFSLEVFAYDTTMGDWRTHSGLDIEATLGSEVRAISAGQVKSITEDALMGKTVTIEHEDGLQSVYANLDAQTTVKVGDKLATGVVIGAIGDTALAESSAPAHLHFELYKDGKPVDPVSYFPEGG